MRNPFTASGRSMLTLLAICLSVGTLGCSDAKQRSESSAHLKHLARAVLKYQTDNGSWPEQLTDVESVIGQSDDLADHLGVIGGGKSYAELATNPLTGDSPGYQYVKPPAEPESYSATVILYQLRGGKRDETLPAGYLDGSVR